MKEGVIVPLRAPDFRRANDVRTEESEPRVCPGLALADVHTSSAECFSKIVEKGKGSATHDSLKHLHALFDLDRVGLGERRLHNLSATQGSLGIDFRGLASQEPSSRVSRLGNTSSACGSSWPGFSQLRLEVGTQPLPRVPRLVPHFGAAPRRRGCVFHDSRLVSAF